MKHNGGPGYQAGYNAKRPRPDSAYNNDRNPNKRARDQRDRGSVATGANSYAKKDTNPTKFQGPDFWKENGTSTTPSASTLPPLPPLLDPIHAKTAFTHTSAATPTAPSYDRLEWYGDSVIEMAATDLLWHHYPPTLPGGRLSQIRESLVNNARLAGFARGYGFDRQLATNLAQAHVSAASWTKVLGDVFEAYVGAVALEDAGTGRRRAEEWLAALWRPLLLRADAFAEEDEAAQDAVKQRAARAFAPSGSGLKAYYEDLAPVAMENKAQQRHTVGFFVRGWEFEGLKLGEGVGQNKKSAKTRAAKDALERVERGDEVLGGLVERVEKYVAEKRAAREEAERAKEAEGRDGESKPAAEEA